MATTSAMIKACLKYDAMGLDVTPVLADVLKLDAVEVRMDKPCGKSHISDRKKCSPDKLKMLTADLKAGDEGAKRRVAEGKKSAQRKQQLNRAVQRDKGKKSEPLDKGISNGDTKRSSSGAKTMIPRTKPGKKFYKAYLKIKSSQSFMPIVYDKEIQKELGLSDKDFQALYNSMKDKFFFTTQADYKTKGNELVHWMHS